jgi:hypothetical protein
MDSNNQIDATISQDALATLKEELETLKPIDGPRKRCIKLQDFRFVFEYSTADIRLRLHISRFRIDWNSGLLKYVPAKKLKNDKRLRPVLERARQKATKTRKSPNPHKSVSLVPGSDESVINDQSQPDEQQFFSQAPMDETGTLNHNYKPGRSVWRMPGELLQHLTRSFSKKSSLDPQPRQGAESATHPTQSISDGNRVAKSDQQLSSLARRLGDSRQGSEFPSDSRKGSEDKVYQPCAPTGLSSQQISLNSASDEDDDVESVSSQAPRASLNESMVHESNRIGEHSPTTKHPTTQPLHKMGRATSRKRQRESVEIECQLDYDEGPREEPKGESPSKKRPRIDTPYTAPNQPSDLEKPVEKDSHTPDTEAQGVKTKAVDAEPIPAHLSRSNRADPWEGLRLIPLSEVLIPKDQANLLEEKLWIPPMPNEQMPQGHVPPSLLRQWNSIAERRHRQAEEAKLVPEQPPIPTQDTVMSSDQEDSGSEESPYDWTPTPEKSRFENRLPDSSPVRQPSFIGIKPVPTLGRNAPSQAIGHNDFGHAESLQKASMPYIAPAEASQSPAESSAAGNPQPLDDDADAVNIMAEASLNEHEQSDADLNELHPSQTLKNQTSNQVPETSEKSHTQLGGLEPVSRLSEDDSGDESEESIMDTSVPLGLGESWPDPTQSTQAEQDVASSAASLPGANLNHVQVAETPANNNHRLHGNEPSKQVTGLRAPATHLPSCQANKTSSPSRVLNTYPYHGSYEKSQSSNEDLNPSSHPSGAGSPRVDVRGTQTQDSSTNIPSHNTTQSQEIVLDSSGPANRHQDFSLPSQDVPKEPSSLLFASSNESVSTQYNEQTQGSIEGCLSQDMPMVSSQVSSRERFNFADPNQGCTPSVSQTSLQVEDESVSRSSVSTPNTQSAALVARRLEHIGNPERVAQAKEVYKRFCDDYPSYTGDFDHFIELCSKLQAVREDGKLRRSFMWDDFIILHLQQYPSHIEQCASEEPSTLSYEEYFTLNFTHPIHRKRSLAAHSIDIAASQFIPADLVPLVASSLIASSQSQPHPPTAQDEVAESSSATLTNKLSDVHADPIKEVNMSRLPAPIGPDFIPSSPADSVEIKVEGPSEDYDASTDTPIQSMEFDEPKDVKLTLRSQKSGFEQSPDTVVDQDIRIGAEGASMGEIEETDLEDTYHETASVELGDESFMSTAPASSSREIFVSVMSPEPESEDENWFVSLRRMHPKSPVWSDDPNTPFKRYVEADQNVLADRLRRGGAKILLNDKGVIRRAIHRD